MTRTDARKIGSCRCNRTTFEVTALPLITMACHCTGCQRMTGSAFSLSAPYPGAAYSVVSGEPVIGGLRGRARHYFCSHCMSWLFTKPEGLDDMVNVRATMFDDAQSFVPFVETYTCEKLPWANTSAVHSYEHFPTPEDYPRMLSELMRPQQSWPTIR